MFAKALDSNWTIPRKVRKKLWGLAFLLPFMTVFFVFTIYPVAMSHVYSFFKWPGYGPLDRFVGLENYIDLVRDPLFWDSLRRTVVFMLGSVLLQVPFALFLALMLNNRRMRGSYTYRTLVFIPVVMTTAVVGVIMRGVFASHGGLVNSVLQILQLTESPIRWLARGRLAMLTIILVASWKWMGIKMVYWLAGLQSVPEELYDAAEVDGADKFQTFAYITVPLLIPVGVVILLISIIDSLRAFELIYTMTEGGPGFSTEVIEVYIYRFAFTSSYSGGMAEMGYASTAAVFFGILAIAISLSLNAIIRKFRVTRQ